jgi:membrane protein implicated in regulation of membrane protease activity
MFDSPDEWRWIWLAAAVVFLVGEIIVAGTFFFLPFAIGAAAATVMAFAGGSVAAGWAVFVGVSAASYAALFRLRHRLDAQIPAAAVGATRWVGKQGVVVRDIPPGDIGMVRLEREEWRAESATGDAIPEGTPVRVDRVDGTRLIVVPAT